MNINLLDDLQTTKLKTKEETTTASDLKEIDSQRLDSEIDSRINCGSKDSDDDCRIVRRSRKKMQVKVLSWILISIIDGLAGYTLLNGFNRVIRGDLDGYFKRIEINDFFLLKPRISSSSTTTTGSDQRLREQFNGKPTADLTNSQSTLPVWKGQKEELAKLKVVANEVGGLLKVNFGCYWSYLKLSAEQGMDRVDGKRRMRIGICTVRGLVHNCKCPYGQIYFSRVMEVMAQDTLRMDVMHRTEEQRIVDLRINNINNNKEKINKRKNSKINKDKKKKENNNNIKEQLQPAIQEA
ncbi:hypothetical protein PPACK8108_LOCUS25950, partial [Phakopsora pachyrhizi]